MSNPVQNSVKKPVSKSVSFKPGMRVIFTTDVFYKTEKGRVIYASKVGVTGKIREINQKGKLIVDLDRKVSARKPVLNDVEPEWIAPILEPVELEAPSSEEDKPSWRGWSYEELKEIAQHHNLTWRETGNERINKMWVIAALKQAGIEPPHNKEEQNEQHQEHQDQPQEYQEEHNHHNGNNENHQ